MRIALLIAALALTSKANADFKSLNSADLGFTTNANLTTDNEDSDLYYRFISRNTFLKNEHRFGIRFGYTDFLSQHQNDLLSLRLEDAWGSRRDFEKKLALVGQLYPNGAAATTETAFNSIGLDFALTRDWNENSRTEGDWGGGYRLRYYTSFAGRNDHTVFGFLSGSYDYSRSLNFHLFGESGLTYSSMSEYRRFYFDITASADLSLTNRWTLSNELTLSHSRFLNRDVSTPTAITNKGRPRVSNRSENEKYMTVYLSCEALRDQTDQFSWGGGIYLTNQSSTSNTQDFMALELMGKALYTF